MPTQQTPINGESVQPGVYLIRNVRWPRYLEFTDLDDGYEMVCDRKKEEKIQWWSIVDLGNENYSIKNHSNAMYANCRSPSEERGLVFGRSRWRQFELIERTPSGRYTIGPTDVQLYWGLFDGQPGSPVEMYADSSQESNQWFFIPVAELPVFLRPPGRAHITGKRVPAGTYLVRNVYSKNYLALPEPNDEIEVVSAAYNDKGNHLWNVKCYEGDEYSIQNDGGAIYANSLFGAKNDDCVFCGPNEQVLKITECAESGIYTIGLMEDELYWGLSDREIGSPVFLCENPRFEGNQWFFIPVN